jgi:hypothetical protein
MDSQYEAAQAPPTAMVAAESLSCQQEASLLPPEAPPNPPPVCIGLGVSQGFRSLVEGEPGREGG